ncbi:MAG: DUF4089 domain-containing protein [Moorea sp. SIO2B7]|nr:DUF4089 domain-containing protein [Moorena sp. SIO2B7]
MENNLNIDNYIKSMSEILNLPLDDPEYYAGVIQNFTILAKTANLVNEFTLPEDIESAPIFQP